MADGYSNKALIGNWFEDRIQENYLKQFEEKSKQTKTSQIPNKVIMDFGHVV